MSNWKKFQEESFLLTEAEIDALQPKIIKSYQTARKSINEAIQEQYLKYLSAVDTDKYYNEMLKYDRLLKLQTQVTADYLKASKEAESFVVLGNEVGFSNNYYRSVYAAQWLVPGYGITVLPQALIEIATLGTESAWKKYSASMLRNFGEANLYGPQIGTLKDLLKKNRVNELAKIQEAITQGLIRGESYTKMSKTVSDVIGYSTRIDGIQHFSGAMANSMRIVSTESTRIMNDAAFANSKQLEAQGINVKKIWIATLDSKTRSTHAQLDGKIKDLDAYYMIGNDRALKPGGFGQVKNNARCRCTVGDIIDDRSPKLRIGKNPVTGENEVFDYKNFTQWAKDNGVEMKKVSVGS